MPNVPNDATLTVSAGQTSSGWVMLSGATDSAGVVSNGGFYAMSASGSVPGGTVTSGGTQTVSSDGLACGMAEVARQAAQALEGSSMSCVLARCKPGRRSLLVVIGLSLVTGGVFAQLPPATAPGPAAVPGRQTPGLITTHAEAKRRLPNTVSDAVVSIEVHGRDLRGTATALGRQSQSLLTFLRGQPTGRLRTDGMSFDP